MKVGIVGLGLIGCSFAKALKLKTHNLVIGVDKNNDTTIKARINRIIDDTLTYQNVSECEIVLLCIPQGEAIKYLEDYSANFSPDTIVLDCCSVKDQICRTGYEMSQKFGYTFVGINPVVDTERRALERSHYDLFNKSSVVLCARYDAPIQALNKVNTFLTSVGFKNIEMSSASENDATIAYTVQLPRIISSSYIISDASNEHYGFSSNAFDDMTRWSSAPDYMADEMVENSDVLLSELDGLIERLTRFSDALIASDTNAVKALLRESAKKKEYLDAKRTNLLE